MKKLYKLIAFFVGLSVMHLTARAQLYAYAPFLSVENSDNVFNANLNTVLYDELNAVNEPDEMITLSRFKDATDFINYPNPATSFTTVGYTLTAKANVVLRVIDLTGKQLAVLVKQQQNAGKQEYYWELAKNNITSGMYILILQVDNKIYSKKIIVQ